MPNVLSNIEICPMCAVALLHWLRQSHLRFSLTALPRTLALIMGRHNLWWNPRRGQVVTDLEILVIKVLVPCTLSNFCATAYPF